VTPWHGSRLGSLAMAGHRLMGRTAKFVRLLANEAMTSRLPSSFDPSAAWTSLACQAAHLKLVISRSNHGS
jgi:hypothetical protein